MKIVLPLLGGCQCGNLRYEVRTAPSTVYICHCRDCQKRTGSAFSMAMPVRADGFAVTRGTPILHQRTTASGNQSHHFYCGDCMIRTHNARPLVPSRIIVRPGTLDDTSWIRPVAQIWSASAQPWANLDDGILTCERDPEDPRALSRAWRERFDCVSADGISTSIRPL